MREKKRNIMNINLSLITVLSAIHNTLFSFRMAYKVLST